MYVPEKSGHSVQETVRLKKEADRSSSSLNAILVGLTDRNIVQVAPHNLGHKVVRTKMTSSTLECSWFVST
jgi:hypothetical protein